MRVDSRWKKRPRPGFAAETARATFWNAPGQTRLFHSLSSTLLDMPGPMRVRSRNCIRLTPKSVSA